MPDHQTTDKRIGEITIYYLTLLALVFAVTFEVGNANGQVSEIELAPKGNDALSYCKELHRIADFEDSAILQNHYGHSVATLNYWFSLTNSEREVALQANQNTGKAIPLPKSKGARFRGFLEGRLGIVTPPRFASRLENCHFQGPVALSGGDVHLQPPFLSSQSSSLGHLSVMDPADFYYSGETATLTIADTTISLRGDMLDSIRTYAEKKRGCLFASKIGDYVYVAVLPPRESTYSVYRFSLAREEVDWVAKVFTGQTVVRGGSGASDVWPHQIELVVSNDQLFVFGICSFSIYVEGFRLDDGLCSFRFSSTYSQITEPRFGDH